MGKIPVIDVILTALTVVTEYLGVATLLYFVISGFPGFRRDRGLPPREYMICRRNRMDTQSGPSCSGYAGAFVLRHLGLQARGEELYQIMPGKMKKGAVHPRGLVKLLNQKLAETPLPDGKKYHAQYCCGSLRQLKYEVSLGIPVIVFIKTRPDRRWLHFVPIVGYDEEYVYIAESLESLRNVRALNYNRRISTKEFRRLWNTRMIDMPLIRNTYIAVRSQP